MKFLGLFMLDTPLLGNFEHSDKDSPSTCHLMGMGIGRIGAPLAPRYLSDAPMKANS